MAKRAQPAPELDDLAFKTQAAFEKWLERNQASSPGIWLRFAKKNSGIQSVTYAEAVESALCFGWIDGQVKLGDKLTYLQRFTPRRRGSVWSQVNREKVLALEAAGRLRPGGASAIADAKETGRWDTAYPSASQATVPPDFEAAMRASKTATVAFAQLNAVNRYAMLFRIHIAKRASTRAERIAKFVKMLEKGESIHP